MGANGKGYLRAYGPFQTDYVRRVPPAITPPAASRRWSAANTARPQTSCAATRSCRGAGRRSATASGAEPAGLGPPAAPGSSRPIDDSRGSRRVPSDIALLPYLQFRQEVGGVPLADIRDHAAVANSPHPSPIPQGQGNREFGMKRDLGRYTVLIQRIQGFASPERGHEPHRDAPPDGSPPGSPGRS